MRGARGMAARLSRARVFCTNHLVLHHLGLVPRRVHVSPPYTRRRHRAWAQLVVQGCSLGPPHSNKSRHSSWMGGLQPLRASGSCGCSAAISLQVISPFSLSIAGKRSYRREASRLKAVNAASMCNGVSRQTQSHNNKCLAQISSRSVISLACIFVYKSNQQHQGHAKEFHAGFTRAAAVSAAFAFLLSLCSLFIVRESGALGGSIKGQRRRAEAGRHA